jgi:two-component sensor histidine kinase
MYMFRRLGFFIGHISDSVRLRKAAALLSIPCFALIEFGMHFGLTELGTPQALYAVADATFSGLLFGLLMWFGLSGVGERRKHVREELARIRELNHEIRNALQIIADSQFDADARRKAMVLESVGRIDMVLNRVFPAHTR